MRVDHHGGFERAEHQESAVRAADPSEAIAIARQAQTGQPVDRREALQAGDDPERTLPVPASVPHLTAQKEHHAPARIHTQRSGRPPGARGKTTRPHTRPGTGRQAPG